MNSRDFTVEESNAKMRAWNEWKQICSVQKCSPDSRQLLRKYIWRRFKIGLKRLDLESPTTKGDVYSKCESQVQFCETEFDEALRENVKLKEYSHLCYKDYYWRKMEQSQDSPLKVLHGSLNWRIKNIVDKWIQKNTGWRLKSIPVIDENGKRRMKRQWIIQTSMDEPLSNGDSKVEDIIPDEQWDPYDSCLSTEVSDLAESMLSLEDAAIILACFTKLLTSPELYAIVNHGDELVTRRKNELIPQVLEMFKENFSGANPRMLRNCLVDWCFFKLETEKRADAFLKMVNEKLNRTR